MAFSKKELFKMLPGLVAEMSKALSHPARVDIILYLLEHGDTRFSEIKVLLPLSGPTISQHLRVLRRSNIVGAYENTPHTYYDLNKDQLRQYMAVMIKFFSLLKQHGIDPDDLISKAR